VQSGSTAVVFLCERMRSLGWRWMNGATPPAGRGEVTTVAVAGRSGITTLLRESDDGDGQRGDRSEVMMVIVQV